MSPLSLRLRQRRWAAVHKVNPRPEVRRVAAVDRSPSRLARVASAVESRSVRPRGLQGAAVILAHNHPSGAAEPSRADEYLTQTLKTALQLVDVRVLDHLVVTATAVVSFAERGLI